MVHYIPFQQLTTVFYKTQNKLGLCASSRGAFRCAR